MTNDLASLQNLQDIVELPPVSFFPLASGAMVLLGVMGLIVLLVLIRFALRYRSHATRRAALEELAGCSTGPSIAAVLRRTALAAYPREEVAPLIGEKWLAWLTQTSGITIQDSVADALTEGLYRDPISSGSTELTDFVAQWIRQHRTPKGNQGR